MPSPSHSTQIRVWDLAVRSLHWSLVAAITVTWVSHEGPETLHNIGGYVVLALIGARIVWGFVGSPYARFRQFLRSPRDTLTYAGAVLRHKERRHIGHNPLGGWMIVVLLACGLALCISGWLLHTALADADWLEELHEGLSNLLLFCILVHIAGVIFTSWRQKENLVAAMISGRKRADASDE